MRCALIRAVAAGAVLFIGACGQVSVCERTPSDESCQLMAAWARVGSLEKSVGGALDLYITGRARQPDAALTATLLQDGRPPQGLGSIEQISLEAHTYRIQVDPSQLVDFRPGMLVLSIAQGTRAPATLPVRLLNQVFQFTPQFPFVQRDIPSYRPMVEAMGFVGNAVVTLNSGTNSMQNPAKSIKRYGFAGGQFSQDMTPDYFYTNYFGAETLAAFSSANVFLLSQLMTNLLLQKCSVSPIGMSDCPPVDMNNQLAVEANKALGVTGEGGVVVMADKNGTLRGAAVGSPLSWRDVQTTVIATSGSTVKVGLGKVDGDDKDDLVAVWQENGKQQVRVLLGQGGGGFAENMSLSMALDAVLSSVTAVAVGDVDMDGYADVVVGRGLELAVLQNQQGGFKQVWSTTLDSTQAGGAIAAVAVGRLEVTDPTRPQDLVAASNTPYTTSMGSLKSTLYLQAFRPQ